MAIRQFYLASRIFPCDVEVLADSAPAQGTELDVVGDRARTNWSDCLGGIESDGSAKALKKQTTLLKT